MGGPPAELMSDSTSAKAHRSATGGKGGFSQWHRPVAGRADDQAHALVDGFGRLVASSSRQANAATRPGRARLVHPRRRPGLRLSLAAPLLLARGAQPVIPNGPRRIRLHPFDPEPYKRRNLVERAFFRIKDFRRIATQYDKLACTYTAAIALAVFIAGWL